MTAVEWLEQELKSKYGMVTRLYSQFDQAKKMEVQQKIDAIIEYAKTHGFIGLVEELEQQKSIPNEQTKESVEKVKEYQNWLREIPEISDEEIEQMLFHHSNEYAYGFKDAIKWYCEQLKQRQ